MGLLPRVLEQISNLPHKTQGQGALVAVALVVLTGLVVIGLSVSNLGSLNAKRSVAVEYALETYYCALSGRQEALATRMIPRSNRLSLSGEENTANKPFNKQSGYCYLNPNGTNSTSLLGIYRYLVVGGDPARDPSNGDWFNINQQPNNTIKQPFYIISQGAICRDNTTKEAKINAISYNKDTKDVVCGTGQYIDRLTTVTEVDFSRLSANQDKINNFQVVQDPNSIALRQPAWIPCQNVTQSMNFNTAYGCGTFPALHHVAFYTPGAGGTVTSVQSPFNTNPTVPANGLMRLFFEGPYDYRTVFGLKTAPLSQCFADPAACNIKLMKLPSVSGPKGQQAVNSFVSVDLIPTLAGSTQLVLAPKQPLAGGSYQIVIGNLNDYLGNSFNGSVTVPFTVLPPGGTEDPTNTEPPTCPYPQIWSPCQQQCTYRKRCGCATMVQQIWDEGLCSWVIDESNGYGSFCMGESANQCAIQGNGNPFFGWMGYE